MASSGLANFPAPGCIVEFLEDNAVQIAMVLEENSGKLRLLLPSRRETKLAASRVLPWAGPRLAQFPGREEAVKTLESHRDARQNIRKGINPFEIWELAQGEVEQADAVFFAGLLENDPDVDLIAATGHALLDCKTHFRLQTPQFQIYNVETVEKRLAEKQAREERESLVIGGANFIRHLWEAVQKRKIAENSASDSLDQGALERIRKILYARMLNPDSQEDESLWKLVSKGLPDDPLVPVQLLMAWGEIPPHYNFWLARAAYDAGDDWWLGERDEVERLASLVEGSGLDSLPSLDLSLLSIDSETTKDIDDAFHIRPREEGGWTLTIALACPALGWPFGKPFDLLVRQRATSLYLPEAEYHMLPEKLGIGSFSLFENKLRPLFCIRLDISETGEILACEPFMAKSSLRANLNYREVEQALEGVVEPQNRAVPFLEMLNNALDMAKARETFRIGNGAIVMQRLDPVISLSGEGEETVVEISPPAETWKAQKIVSEMMIAASAKIADWANERKIPLVHRSQDVLIPREYAGIWSTPWDIARIMRSLVPSVLEVAPAPHSALGLSRYAPVTSPLRRYADLLNEAQIMEWLVAGRPLWSSVELQNLLSSFSPALESASHVQKNRPRYWKLLYFRQQGEERLWPAVVTEENENFVTIAIPEKALFVRGRRNLFDDKIVPGSKVNVKLGRIHPLHNDVHILEATGV